MPYSPVVAALAAVPLLMGFLTGCGADAPGAAEPSLDTSETVQGNDPADNGPNPVPIGTPCPMAVHGDPSEIAAKSEATVYWPSDGADRITEAWRCADTPVFMFDDVQVSFEGGWDDVPIPQKFQDLADDGGGSVEIIQGLDAYVVGSTPNDEVLMVKDGNAIRLLAPGDVPIERLVALAGDLDLANPINR
jgi:hypothetical protein